MTIYIKELSTFSWSDHNAVMNNYHRGNLQPAASSLTLAAFQHPDQAGKQNHFPSRSMDPPHRLISQRTMHLEWTGGHQTGQEAPDRSCSRQGHSLQISEQKVNRSWPSCQSLYRRGSGDAALEGCPKRCSAGRDLSLCFDTHQSCRWPCGSSLPARRWSLRSTSRSFGGGFPIPICNTRGRAEPASPMPNLWTNGNI